MIDLKIYSPKHSEERDNIKQYIIDNYDSSYDDASSIILAMDDHYDYVIVLTKDNVVKGAISYFISNRNKFIEVDHIGVIEHNRGYGSLLMKSVFKISLQLDKSVSLITSGSSNKFYEKMGMTKLNKKIPTIYEISLDNIKLLDVMGIIIRFHM